LLNAAAPPSSLLFPCTTLFRSADAPRFVVLDLEDAKASDYSDVTESIKSSSPDTDVLLVNEPGNEQLNSSLDEISNVAVVDWDSDRKSTRLNSSHVSISYAVFC